MPSGNTVRRCGAHNFAMTRLVRVRAVCDECSAAPATIYCVAHRHVLCVDCDPKIHSDPRLSPHQRITLNAAITALPFCEYCDNAPATTYCETESTTLCDKCDQTVHMAAPLSHWRTPIEKTLRSRAVQFRPSSRSVNGPTQPAPADTAVESAQRSHILSQSATPSHTNASTTINSYHPPRNVLNSSPIHSLHHNPSKSRQVVRKNLPHLTQVSHQPNSSPLESITRANNASRSDAGLHPDNSTNLEFNQRSQLLEQTSRNPLFHTEDYSPFFDSHHVPSDMPATLTNPNFVPLPREIADAAKSLCDPLIISAESPELSLERDPLAEPDSSSIDLDNVVTCPSLDPSPEEYVLEQLKTSTTIAPLSAKPSSKVLSTEPPLSIRQSFGTPQSSITVVAAAATAAAERYLLKTTSHASSSCEQVSNPAVECEQALDPGGVAEAATAAAESAAAAVDIGPMPTNRLMACDRHHPPRLPRNASEPILPLRAAAEKHVADEALRRLDIAIKPRLKDEMFTQNARQSAAMYGPNDAGATVQEMNDHEYGRRDVLMDPEIQKEGFLVFDALDMSQYDQSDPRLSEFSAGGFETHIDLKKV